MPLARRRIAMLANNPCVTDARIRREAEALAEMGHALVIFAHWKPGLPALETVNGVEYRRLPMRHFDRRQQLAAQAPKQADARPTRGRDDIPGTVLTILSAISWRASVKTLTPSGDSLVRHARRFTAPAIAWQPDVVHAHDLYTLHAGARIARRTGARLVYDSHELELGRSGTFSRRELWLRARAERALIAKTSGVITVCDSIADYLANHYAIARPAVVHNAPALNLAAADGQAVPDDVRRRIGLPPTTPLAIYVGSVTFNRGIEQSVRALALLPGVHMATVGPRNASIEASIRRIATELGVADRLHLIDAVPHDQVTRFVSTADVSLVTVQNVCLSYKFCFPNKLLESLLAGVPVVAARLDELERMVALTGGGLVVDETDPAAIARGIDAIVRNKAQYLLTPEKIRFLQETFSWERQVAKLGAFYDQL